ncbi:MAG: hypothetical protein IJB97_05770 [Clostridia bacterium]|nr:hypothetical protein [Clostridia bacterium]
MKAIFKNLIKRTTAALLLSATLIAVLVGVVGGKTPPMPRSVDAITASADDKGVIYQDKLLDDNFAFISGGALLNTTQDDGTHKFNYMSYTLNLKNANFRNFSDDKDKSWYTFTLYRQTTDGLDYPLSKFKIVRSNGVILMLKKSITNFEGYFEFYPLQAQGINAAVVAPEAYEKATKEFLKDGWELQYALASHHSRKITQDIVWNDEISDYYEYPHLRLIVKTPEGIDSMAVKYFVEFDYEVKDYIGQKTGWVWWWESKDDIRTKKGKIYTSIRSPKGILQNMKDQGALEEEFPDEALRQQAEEILGVIVKKRITVSYLEQIGDTPFAHRVEKSFDMYVSNGVTDLEELQTSAVLSALNKGTFYILGSSVNVFEKNEAKANYYVAKYDEGIYIKCYTNSGNSVDPNSKTGSDYFLDLNSSFSDYYGGLVNAGVISEDMYSKIFNEIKIKNPVLEKYSDEEIYGYFGYVVIPTSYNLSDVWGEILAAETSIGGVCITFKYTDMLTKGGYTALLEDYNYHWIERTLSAIGMATLPTGAIVDHYAFYADNGTSEDVWIGQNGAVDADDDSPEFTKTVEEQALELMQSTMDFLNESGVKSTVSPWNDRGFRVTIAILTVGAMVVCSVYVYVRYGAMRAGDVHINMDSDVSATKKKSSPAKKTATKKKK